MSGIGGRFNFNQKPVAKRDLERVASSLQIYGPDRSGVISSNQVGFVNTLMRMTPEDQFDLQPYSSSSGAMITADVRLDNRDDILTWLKIPPDKSKNWPDSKVLLAAYEHFGDDLWPKLRGPFAAAIWKPKQQTLILARDHIGLNVLMWYKTANFFAFATMPKGLFAFPEVPRELNDEKLADFLVLNHSDHTTTVYKNIFRVPPAHVMTVSPDGTIKQRCYWSPSNIKPIRLPSDQAYADGMRECLDRAVKRQLRSVHPIGCQLTGGLDSSSIAMLAAEALKTRKKRLTTYTQVPRKGFDGAVPNGCYADETPFVEAIAEASGNIDPNYIYNDECDDFSELERFFSAMEAPVRNPTNLGWMLAVSRLARKKGNRVLLGGLCGNSTISWSGWTQAIGHLLAGRWYTAFRQWQLYHRTTSFSAWVAFRKLFIEPVVPDRFANWAYRRRHPDRITGWQEYAPIKSDFADKARVADRARVSGHDFLYRMRRDDREAGLLMVDYLGDWLAAEKAITGVESRHPTLDVDVIEYCFGVPPKQYLVEGVDRSLIRRAMWGVTPKAVLTNRLSGCQSADWYEKLDKQRDDLARQIGELSSSKLVQRTLDLERLDRALKNWPDKGWDTKALFTEYNLVFARGFAAARFLKWIDPSNH